MCYQGFKKFNPKEIHHHLGVYIFHGLSPSPQVYTKFKLQRVDKVHSNYFIYNLFGPDANRHHKNFKAFFALPKPPYKTSNKNKISKLEGAASSYVDIIYISNRLDAWCRLFHRWNDHAFQRSPCGQKKDDLQSKRLWITDILSLSERIHISNIYV